MTIGSSLPKEHAVRQATKPAIAQALTELKRIEAEVNEQPTETCTLTADRQHNKQIKRALDKVFCTLHAELWQATVDAYGVTRNEYTPQDRPTNQPRHTKTFNSITLKIGEVFKQAKTATHLTDTVAELLFTS
jgi:hypothetical protein